MSEKYEHEHDYPQILPEEKISDESLFKRSIRITAAVLMMAGIIYTSGIYQFLFYQRTDPAIESPVHERRAAGETITITIDAFVFSAEEFGASARNRDDIARMIEQAGRIWEQAGIALALGEFVAVPLASDDLRELRRDPVAYLRGYATPPEGSVRAYFVHNLAGINGVAYGGSGTIALADHTSTFDFRVFAHEIGHVLGLGHTSDSSWLMSSGASGTYLSDEEIERARKQALEIAD